ncbi:MAG: glycosyltransferase [Saprospiraceae bacterium]|nr:glycosyltransferase [Saprospiraceae bacterium]
MPLDKTIIAFSSMKISDERKGMKILIEAMEYLQNQYPLLFNNLFILAIGKNSDQIALNINILFSGFISDENSIIEYYQCADLFISPSLQDNLSNTVLESMACGLPSIVFNIGGMSDLVQNQVNGLLIQK